MMLLGKLSETALSYESGSSRQRTQSAISNTAKRGSSRTPSTKGERVATSICRTELDQASLLAVHPPPSPRTELQQSKDWAPGVNRAQWHQAGSLVRGSRTLLEGSLDPFPSWGSGGVSAGSGRPLIRGQSGQGLGWSPGHQPPLHGPRTQAYLPGARLSSVPALPPAAGSCGERRVRAGNHQAPQPAAPTPFPTPTQPVGRGGGGLRSHPQVLKKGLLVSRTWGTSYPWEKDRTISGRPAAATSTAVAQGSKEG